MTPRDPPYTPFFANKARAFWYLQAAGWTGAAALRIASNFAASSAWRTILFVFLSTVVGYCLSLILSLVYRQVLNKKPVILWSTTFGAFAVAAATYSVIDTWVFTSIRPDTESPYFSLLLANLYIEAILLAAWSALYYAINYYVRAEEQQDQMLYLAAQAATAQLAMLRYQLNPHFLFNTLNSISTLVLLKETDAANAMLSRLSSFLRSTLTETNAGMVTIAQEVETLKLYLDIEKMRFEERLRVSYTVDENARDAMIPSLLLQPLVENAVKYAVSAKEDGADIAVSAQLIGPNVRIIVSDTGPGLHGEQARDTVSTGVGMANIRERLIQTYGTNHRFDTTSKPTGGFEVAIELPYGRTAPGQLAVFSGGQFNSGLPPRLTDKAETGTPQNANLIGGSRKGMIEA